MYADAWETKSLNGLLVDEKTKQAILAAESLRSIKNGYESELAEFAARRAQFLLYPSE